MKSIKTIIALLISCAAFGQTKTFYNTREPNGDSTFWFKHQMDIVKKIGLPRLDTSTTSEHVRIWTNSQAIDVWQNISGEVGGTLTTFTDEYTPYGEEPTNRTFFKTNQLASDSSRIIWDHLTSNKILRIPTDDSINGWQRGFDGIVYIIEHSTEKRYALKSYWSPKSQNSLKEARRVQTFVESALNMANASVTWKAFSEQIPFECYYNGGPAIAMRILTSEQRREYKKERQKYRQQQHENRLEIPSPHHFEIIDTTYGDLDNDGINELVVAYNTAKKDSPYDSVIRNLSIYKMRMHKWILWKESTQALFGSRDGGMMGDPFGDIRIEKGTLLISQSGGSSWKWNTTDKYRFQDGEFYLIGYSSQYGKPCEYWEDVDFNLSTGLMLVKKEFEDCEKGQAIYKSENERFYKKGIRISLQNRRQKEMKITSPKYKHEIYVATTIE